MKGLFVFLLLILVGVACLGFYRGWFRIGSVSTDGETNVTLTVDQKKIKADEDKAVEKLRNAGQSVTDKAHTTPPAQSPQDDR